MWIFRTRTGALKNSWTLKIYKSVSRYWNILNKTNTEPVPHVVVETAHARAIVVQFAVPGACSVEGRRGPPVTEDANVVEVTTAATVTAWKRREP